MSLPTDGEPADWQIVESASVSPCGSSPRSIHQDEFAAELEHLLDEKDAEDKESAQQDTNSSESCIDVIPIAEKLPPLPTSIVHDLTPAREEDGSSIDMSDSPALSDDELPLEQDSGSQSELSQSGSQTENSRSIFSESENWADESGCSSMMDTGDPDIDNVDNEMSHIPSTDISQSLEETHDQPHVANLGVPSEEREITPKITTSRQDEPKRKTSQQDAELDADLKILSSNSDVSISSRIWNTIRAYLQAATGYVPFEVRIRICQLSKRVQVMVSRSVDSKILLVSGLISVSGLLMWSLARNRSLNRQLLRTQMDMDHHILTILNLNDKLAQGLALPITRQCSYGSSQFSVTHNPLTTRMLSTSIF